MIDPRSIKRADEEQRANAPVPCFWTQTILSLAQEATYNKRAREGANKRTRETR